MICQQLARLCLHEPRNLVALIRSCSTIVQRNNLQAANQVTAGRSSDIRSLEFRDVRKIYATKSNKELLRSYFVFSLCSVDFLVNRQAKVGACY